MKAYSSGMTASWTECKYYYKEKQPSVKAEWRCAPLVRPSVQLDKEQTKRIEIYRLPWNLITSMRVPSSNQAYSVLFERPSSRSLFFFFSCQGCRAKGWQKYYRRDEEFRFKKGRRKEELRHEGQAIESVWLGTWRAKDAYSQPSLFTRASTEVINCCCADASGTDFFHNFADKGCWWKKKFKFSLGLVSS